MRSAVGPDAPASAAPAAITLAGRGRAAFPAWKRGLDLALGTAGLIVATPVIVVVAIAMRASADRGPVFYRALRVGEGGRPFRIVKLRTMRAGSDGPAITSSGDDRITSLGRRLRRTKLDELPQLWNVLRGEMSIVGPRPEDAKFVDWSDPLHRLVFTARPGITGLAQVAYRDEEALVPAGDSEAAYRERILPAKLALDADYLRHRTLRGDLRIIARTVLAVVDPGRTGRIAAPDHAQPTKGDDA
jgi:lipopolysaccharide/colanic/teichoic acid biosynthesis glycosyltransferase